MIFLISLALGALFIRGCARPLKKHPAVFYIAASVIALAVIGCTRAQVSFPAWFQTWVWPLVSRGAFATALFAAVMWAGALPNGSKAIRLLMPIRGELSILACILTLAHNISYGRTYFRFLFAQPDRLPANQLAAAVCSLVLMVIMLPLFVTSFPAVRKKMNARSWKRLQRLVYVFYALLYVHIMLLSVPYALKGRSGYTLNMLVYSVMFLGYAVCRVMKAQARKTRTPDKLVRRQAAAMACALVVSLCLTGAVSVFAAREENTLSQTTARQESSEPEGTPEQSPEPEAPEDVLSVEAGTSDPENNPVPSADAQPEESQPAEETPEPSPSGAPQESQTQAPAPEPTPTPTPTPTPAPTPERTYRNGTFSGSGEGYWSTIQNGGGILSADTADLLNRALELCGRTNGALDLSIYPVVRAWGFTTGEYRVPGSEELEELLTHVDYTQIALDEGSGQVSLAAGMEIDLGSVAKGYTGDRLVCLLRESGVTSALLNLGGNVQALGSKPDGSPWRIAVRAPFRDGYTGILEVTDQAVITSSGYERCFEKNGQTYWHILDPAAGTPVYSGLVSVTIVGDSGLVYDGLSTALFVMGLEDAADFWRGSDDFEAILVTESGQVHITEGLEDVFSLPEDSGSEGVTVIRRG